MADDALAVVEGTGPLEMFSGEQMAELFVRYKGLQDALDRSMPDQIMAIGDKKFRKKGYWRAIAVAFKLTVEPTEERREVRGSFGDGQDNFGYIVTYRAMAPNGRFTMGDGSCFAIEKASRRGTPEKAWQVRPPEATEHNVRSHAHTRAFNRAVSNLVGFGEVSAEEADFSDGVPLPSKPTPVPKLPPFAEPDEQQVPGEPTITVPQAKRLWAIARGAGWSQGGIKAHLSALGYEHSTEIPRRIYEQLITQIETQAPR